MLTRRACLKAAPALLLASNVARAQSAADSQSFDPVSALPHRAAFAAFDGVYLNSASQHPLRKSGRAAIDRYLDYKTFAEDSDYSNVRTYQDVLGKYAMLINADFDEVCFLQSTTAGENLVLKALGIPESGGRIVTDDLHYVGSQPTYAEMATRGMDVVTLRADSDGRIGVDRFDAAIDRRTRIVCVSLVSMLNGHLHDLPAICEIAHSRGALVYADVVQAVGGMPFDVRDSGVDFCAGTSYKWLMGEQGLGFLYVRRDRLGEIRRPWFGHYQLNRMRPLGFPATDGGSGITDYVRADTTPGFFAMGSQPNILAALLHDSLDYLLALTPERIQRYRQPLIDRLQDALPRLGYAPLTPRDAGTPIVSFRHTAGGAEATREKLRRANVTATVAPHHVRFSPSVFNDMDDIERVVDALG